MNKKYLVILVVVVAIATGLYLHIQKKKEANQAVHHAKQYERMLAMARKSPMAGLTQMGAAINKYKAERQAFPPKLMDLYPQYIPSKEFITDIQWVYKPSGGDFYLSKSMVLGEKTRLASVSSTLMPQMESATMVAASGGAKGKGKAAGQVKMQSHEDFVASLSANQALAKRQEAAYRARYRQKKAPVIPLVTETVSFESADEVDLERGNLLEGRFYCWKNDDGSYGYSNIQYPERRKVEKFNAGQWMVVQTEFNQRPQSPDETVVDPEAQALAALDRHRGQNLIVWRDPKGLIGYGNVQYPQTEKVEQYDGGHWTALAGTNPDVSDAPEDELIRPADITIAEIGARHSDDYMVWQDEAGHVGFSNVQYPEQKPLQHYREGQWVAVKPVQWDAEAETSAGSGSELTEDAVETNAVTAASNQNYIVWRDADGHIGISNVQLPTSTDQLEVHMDGEWLAAAQ